MTEARNNVWEDLVVSILSVNRYPLERTYSHIEGLRQQGLVEPENLATWTSEEIASRLGRAGYDRGVFMITLFAHRLASLGALVRSTGAEECERMLIANDFNTITALLIHIDGIGPKVLENFFVMRGTRNE